VGIWSRLRRPNNRHARYYTLTPQGRRALEREERRWERVTDTIGSLLEGA
jgi:DNA-binding PadR family transcriptional regulator